VAVVDSGTSGMAIPDSYFSTVVAYITSGLSCSDLICNDVDASSFPTLYVSLAPDNVFPLLPSDYVECSVGYTYINLKNIFGNIPS